MKNRYLFFINIIFELIKFKKIKLSALSKPQINYSTSIHIKCSLFQLFDDVVTGLGIHLRLMVSKGKSLLFGHISRIFKKNGGGTATTVENRRIPPKPPFAANKLLSFFAELRHF